MPSWIKNVFLWMVVLIPVTAVIATIYNLGTNCIKTPGYYWCGVTYDELPQWAKKDLERIKSDALGKDSSCG